MTQLQPRSASTQPNQDNNAVGFWVFMLAWSAFPIIIVLLYVFN